jgi:predicted metal-dependent peptidase
VAEQKKSSIAEEDAIERSNRGISTGPIFKTEKEVVYACNVVRDRLYEDSPFLVSVLSRLPIKYDSNFPMPGGTDGYVIYMNPRMFLDPNFKELNSVLGVGFVLIHEIFHVIFQHMIRRENRNPTIWNMATDYAVNLLVAEILGYAPEGVLYNEAYTGMSAEQIYDKLIEGGGNGNGGRGGGEDGDEKGRGGGGGEGPKKKVKAKGYKPFDEHIEPKIKDEARLERFKNRIKEIVMESFEEAKDAELKARGSLPAWLQRIYKIYKTKVVDWRKILFDFVYNVKTRETTYRVPGRRTAAGVEGEGSEFLFPGRRREEAIKLAVGIDTSGSIDDEQLNIFMTAIQNLLDSSIILEVVVLPCDAGVAIEAYNIPPDKQILTNGDKVGKIKVTGGGGSDTRPVFEYFERWKYRWEPDAMVYLTDLDVEFPSRPPKYPVLWITLSEIGQAPFGRVVRVETLKPIRE